MIDELERAAGGLFHVKHSISLNCMRTFWRRKVAAKISSLRPPSAGSGNGIFWIRRSSFVSSPTLGASWVDVGSGAGLPGVVIACIVEGAVVLINRELRANFLQKVVDELGLGAAVECCKAEKAKGQFGLLRREPWRRSRNS